MAGASGPMCVVTGFEPFGGRARNRSWQAVLRLAGRPGVEIARLPVDFARLPAAVDALAAGHPRAVLLTGEAPIRALRAEQVALNLADADRPDNAGRAPRSEVIAAGGPLALRATWDARAVAARLIEARVPARASFHAGTYACNAALYLALHRLPAGTRIGFLHVPRRGWPIAPRLGAIVRALELSLEALLAP